MNIKAGDIVIWNDPDGEPQEIKVRTCHELNEDSVFITHEFGELGAWYHELEVKESA